jgi:hypothetical protein
MGVIYGLCDPDTGEVRYVGKMEKEKRIKPETEDEKRARLWRESSSFPTITGHRKKGPDPTEVKK